MGNGNGGGGGHGGGHGGSHGGGNRDYSNCGSFGKAFNKAHSQSGPGSTFTYNGKSYNTNCADGGNYRTNPVQHTYSKDSARHGTFNTNGNNYDARSGFPTRNDPSQKYGPIPDGSYKVTSKSNTGGIERYNLTPQQDIGIRSNLQIHQKSDNVFKNLTGTDTLGCISVDKAAMNNVKIGDTLKVDSQNKK